MHALEKKLSRNKKKVQAKKNQIRNIYPSWIEINTYLVFLGFWHIGTIKAFTRPKSRRALRYWDRVIDNEGILSIRGVSHNDRKDIGHFWALKVLGKQENSLTSFISTIEE